MPRQKASLNPFKDDDFINGAMAIPVLDYVAADQAERYVAYVLKKGAQAAARAFQKPAQHLKNFINKTNAKR